MARRFSFILPADWWRIPLVNEEARTANIDHMVDHQFPSIDEAAQLRHDIKEELHKQAAQAAQVGGLVMAFYLLNLDGTPVSATMTSYDLTGLLSLPVGLNSIKSLAHYVGDTELDESLPDLDKLLFPDGIPETQPTETEETPTELVIPSEPAGTDAQALNDQPQIPWVKVTGYDDILAYRREKIDPGTDHFGDEAPKIEQLQVTYVQNVPDFGLVQTVFSSPLTQARDAWIQMWDAMIAAFRADTSDNSDNSETSESEE